MDPISVPATPRPAIASLPARTHAARVDEDEVPLGWECANPALQIERWRVDDERGLSGNS
jgi:hypothetical protein